MVRGEGMGSGFILLEHTLTAMSVSAIKPYEGFGDVDHTIKELMSL
jgi:hypothetical protein